LNTADRGGSSV